MNTTTKTQLKSAADMIVPAVASVFIFRFARKESTGLKEPVIFAALGFLAVWFIISKLTTSLVDETKTVNVTDLNPNGTPGSGTVGNAVSYDGGPLAVRLRADIYSFGLRDKDVYKQIANLSDAELMQVYNAYNRLFKAQDKEGMLLAMSGETYGNNWMDTVAADVKNIMSRLRRYGVTD